MAPRNSQSTTKLHLKWYINDVFFSSSEAQTRKNGPPAGCLQRGLPGTPAAAPRHQPAGGRGRGFAATTSALVGASVLTYDAASTYCSI